MNILIVTAMFPPIRTGTSHYSRNLATVLSKLGHKITLVTVNSSEPVNDTYPFEVVRIKGLRVTLKNFFKHLCFSSIFPSNYKVIKSIAKQRGCSALLVVNHYLDIVFPAIYAATKLKLPLYISVGTQMQSSNAFRNHVLRLLDRIVCGELIFPFCQKIIAWDSEIERYIQEVQPTPISSKSVIIPFGANGNIDELSAYNHDYSLKNQILGVGSVLSQRDYLFQVRVFKELLKIKPNLRYKIIGHIYTDAPIRLAKSLGIDNRIEFTGELPHDKVIEEMHNSDIHWMMTSVKYVGLGTATIEAMLLGIPSISNSPRDLFGDAKLIDMENYIYTDSKDVQSVIGKIIAVMDSEELRIKIGRKGREFVETNLNWDIVGKQVIDLLEDSC